jgi:Rieske Fe-S protein
MSNDHEDTSPTRRGLLSVAVYLLGSGIALLVGVPGTRFALTPVRREGDATWVDLGPVADIAGSDTPSEKRVRFEARVGYTVGQRPALLLLVPDPAEPDGVRALSPVCPHKGCNVSWAPEEDRFACPCHEGRFDRTGAPVSGPPDGPLPRLETRVREGRLEVRIAEGLA